MPFYLTVDYEGEDVQKQQVIEGFGPRTILGAVEDLLNDDESMGAPGMAVKRVVISTEAPDWVWGE